MRRPGTIVALLAAALVAGSGWARADEVTPHTLPNGLRLLVRTDPAADVVAISLQARAGSRFETAERAGLTHLLHRVMLRGTARHSAVQLVEAAEEIGGVLDAAGEVESAEIHARALARHWDRLLSLVAEVALTPTIADRDVERERRLILSQIDARTDSPFLLALDALLAALCGDHPCSRPSLGTAAAVRRFTRRDLVALHREIYRPERLVLAVSGPVPPRQVIRLVETLFGALPRAPFAMPEPPPLPAPSGGRRRLERAVHEARILVGYRSPGLGEPDYAAAKVLAAILGGGMSGRLFGALREERGLAYSVGVLSPFRTSPAFLVAHLGTEHGNVDTAEATLLGEIERLTHEPIAERDLARGRAQVLGAFAMDRRTHARHAWYLAFLETVGLGWRFADRYTRAVEAVTVADVGRVARTYLRRPTVIVLRRPD